jgi:hypothetical protein
MACDWFEGRLQQVLDARRDPLADETLASHARECADCHEWLDAQRILFLTLSVNCVPESHETRHSPPPISPKTRRQFTSVRQPASERQRASALQPASERQPGKLRKPSSMRELPSVVPASAREWSVVVATAAVAVSVVAVLAFVTAPRSRHSDVARNRSSMGWKATVAEWSSASGRWLAGKVAPVSVASSSGDPSVGRIAESPAWEFHWVARVGYSLAATETPPVEQIEELAGTIRPLASSMYRVVETLRPKWQVVEPPLAPETSRDWEPLDRDPPSAPRGSGERNSSWRMRRSWTA